MTLETRIKKKLIRDMAKEMSLLTPTLAKKKTTAASLKPSPPIDMGSKVIAPIIGKKIKK